MATWPHRTREVRVREPRRRKTNLPNNTTLTTLDRLTREQAKGWARRLRKMVEDDPVRTPAAHLIARGMEDEDMRAQILREYERVS